MKDHADQQTFREWLVKQLTLTRWTAHASTHPIELALRLGVRLDVLQEAIALRRAVAEKQGQGKPLGLLIPRDYAVVAVAMPPAVAKDWLAFCGELRLVQSAVLRSLVHHFLSTRSPPRATPPSWIYRGVVHPMPVGTRNYKTRVTRGAQAALEHRATEFSVSKEAILRGLITDVLEGHLRRFRPVAYSELWGDADRYLHPEKFK